MDLYWRKWRSEPLNRAEMWLWRHKKNSFFTWKTWSKGKGGFRIRTIIGHKSFGEWNWSGGGKPKPIVLFAQVYKLSKSHSSVSICLFFFNIEWSKKLCICKKAYMIYERKYLIFIKIVCLWIYYIHMFIDYILLLPRKRSLTISQLKNISILLQAWS